MAALVLGGSHPPRPRDPPPGSCHRHRHTTRIEYVTKQSGLSGPTDPQTLPCIFAFQIVNCLVFGGGRRIKQSSTFRVYRLRMSSQLLAVLLLLSLVLAKGFLSTAASPRLPVSLFAKRKGVKDKVKEKSSSRSPIFIDIEDFYSDGWKLSSAVDVLRNGGIGVIPTDTCYSFVTPLSSRKGIERLITCKGNVKKPLSILCKDLSMVDMYTSDETSREKWIFKLLKNTLPGPYTFIMPSSPSNLPKMIVDRKHHKLNKWKRTEIGIRIPDDAICSAILNDLNEPLLCGSVPEAAEDQLGIIRPGVLYNIDEDEDDNSLDDDEDDDDIYDLAEGEGLEYDDLAIFDSPYYELNNMEKLPWAHAIDVVVLNGPRGGSKFGELSTVVDLTGESPVLVREGKGVFIESDYR